VLFGHDEPEVAKHCERSLAPVEADASLGGPLLARLRDEGMTTAPQSGPGNPIENALEQKA
jgi:hypothetical protein